MTSSLRLRIRDVEARAVVAPMNPPVRTASGSVSQALLVLIDLHTEEGPVGRAYLAAYQPYALRPLRELVRELGATVKGQAVAPIELDRALRSRFTLLGGARGLQGMAVSGIDLAAWDALAVAAGVPLVTLLGGEARPIPAYNSLGMLGPGEAADDAGKTVAAGFRAMKIKVGWPLLDEDLAGVRAARRALPDDVALMVDFNQSLTVAEAIRRGRALDGEGVAWIEEPVRATDFHGAAEIAAALATPVQIGENLAGPFEMEEALRLRASDLVMPDVQQIGGVTGWLRAARWPTRRACRARAISSSRRAPISWRSRRRVTGSSTSTWRARSWPSPSGRWTARCARPPGRGWGSHGTSPPSGATSRPDG